MRLIKLSANQSGFKEVRFNKTGISLIVAKKENDENTDEDRSFNGVGKSLLIEIIHFCLGSSSNKAFEKCIPNWEFYLEFEINGNSFLSSRSTNKQDTIYLNNKSYKCNKFNHYLAKLTFDIPDEGKYLTFRSLYPRFMRRYIEDYNDPKKIISENDYAILIRNLFLLGIDIDLVKNKYDLKLKKSKLDESKSNFKKDDFIKQFYTGNKNVSLQAAHLEEKIKNLDMNLSNFQVANDYYEIEQDANKINIELIKIKNRKTVIENTIENIDKCLQIKSDISKEKILALYGELLSTFKNETIKKVEDIENFNLQLIKNRISRLSQEKLKLISEMECLTQNLEKKSTELNKKLSYLSNRRALDQYTAVTNQKSELQSQLQKIKDYQILLNKIDNDILDIQKKLAEESIKTQEYLRETEDEREKKFQIFSRLVKKIYPTAPAGISLKNNTGENQIRYNFDVRIESDSSDGINSAKIFCYDLFLLILNCNHHINFIWHDSRLFSDIDPRQRAILFKLGYELSNSNGKQYIATINQHELDAMRPEFSDEDFNLIFDQTTVLTLKDDKPESKLLGKKIDMTYHLKRSK